MTTAELKGVRMAWADAEALAKGTRRERRAVRRRWAKSRECDAAFWRAYRGMFFDRLEAFGDAIRDGRLPRTIAPSKIFYVLNNV